MLVWPKYIVAWLCGLIASDGSIVDYYHEPNNSRIKKIEIICTAYLGWAKDVQKILREYVIGTSIQGPYKNKSTKSYPSNPNALGAYHLRLNQYYPKNRQSGVDQYQAFRNNVEYWGLQNLLVDRKYKKLCGLTKPMPINSEAMTQKHF